MQIRSVGHACLEIETAGKRILTDPWWTGPAYTNQWYPWPTPRPDGLESRKIDYVFLSHGHEDHLHPQTLQTLRPGATALVPYMLTGGMADYLRGNFGIGDVIELRHGETVTLENGIRATCFVNLTDSMLVLESEGEVLINANDALHASPPATIDYFCRMLAARYPRIDTLFLGFGGASWFPNCIHYPGKDDRAVARAREELFSNNFLRVVERLRPRLACPFAASFVLLEPQNLWMNHVKFDMPGPDRELERRGGIPGVRCHMLLPGDRIDGVEVMPGGVPRPSRESFEEACRTTLKDAFQRATDLQPLTLRQMGNLIERIRERMVQNRSRLNGPLEVHLQLRDAPEVMVRVMVTRTSAEVELRERRPVTPLLETRSEILEAALTDDYGVESLIIGYGGHVMLEHQAQFTSIRQLLRMLTPREEGWRTIARDVMQSPTRTLDAMWRQRWPVAVNVGTRLGLLSHAYELSRLGASKPSQSAA